MEEIPKISYAILLLSRDKRRSNHVQVLVKKHPYFHIREAVDAKENWEKVEKIFVDNGIKATSVLFYMGKYGCWASFIEWLVWLRDVALAQGYTYGVLAEDDVNLVGNFQKSLSKFIVEHPDYWYFRCGPYNSCLVIRCDQADKIIKKIRETGVDMPNDWWSWKKAGFLQPRGPQLATQSNAFRSNIVTSRKEGGVKVDYSSEMWVGSLPFRNEQRIRRMV